MVYYRCMLASLKSTIAFKYLLSQILDCLFQMLSSNETPHFLLCLVCLRNLQAEISFLASLFSLLVPVLSCIPSVVPIGTLFPRKRMLRSWQPLNGGCSISLSKLVMRMDLLFFFSLAITPFVRVCQA